MPTDKELMQQALDALDLVTDLTTHDDVLYEAIDALRERLAQPEPEPVAQVQVAEDYHAHVIWTEGVNLIHLDQKFLYTVPNA